MNNVLNSCITCLLILFGVFSQINLAAQKAVIAGKVVDKETGESLIGVTIKAINTSGDIRGAITDYDGNYRIEVDPAPYTITTSYTAFTPQTVENFEVKSGVLNTLDFALGTESAVIAEVVVVSTTIKNTDASLIALQKRSLSIQDGISSQQISRTGVSNAADAMKQVTGAVVEGGKFIVMRGLGDRYSISQLNGITMPSTDPYRNSSSLDLIPSQMIDNIVTMKTFTPDLPGNFSGGLVNITTKSVPEKFTLYFGLSSSFNTQSTFNQQFQGHGDYSGRKDWLGFDDGTRDLPPILTDERNRALLSQSVYLNARNPSEDYNSLRALLNESSRSLSNTFTTTPKTAPLNHGLNFSIGDNLRLFGNTLGFSLGVNYSREYTHYENGAVNTWLNNSSSGLFGYQLLNETKSTETPHLGGLFNLTYKIGSSHSIGANVIYNNDTDIIGRSQNGSWVGQLSNPSAAYNTQSMEFVRRQYTSYQLTGRHVFNRLNDAEIRWSGSLNKSLQQEPDTRFFAYINYIDDSNEERFEINEAEFKPPFHFWRDLDDESQEFKVDISIPFLQGRSNTNQIKFGGLYSKMTRDFTEYQFLHNRHSDIPVSLFFNSFNGNFDAFFDYANFGIIDTLYKTDGSIQRYRLGYHYINQVNNKNFYNGDQEIMAGYGMLAYNILPRLKVVGGARVETTDLFVASRDTMLAPSALDLTDWLYSANLIYSLSEKTNIRLAATRTLARPNMRELTPFEQFDTKNGFFNLGNPALQRTLIDNYDIRYEFFPDLGEVIAVSAFYKQFRNPILRRFSPTATIPELGYINIGKANVYGLEFEFRKNLGFLGNVARNLYLGANFALIKSAYDIPADEVAASKQIDPSYDLTTRPFQGQAPFIVNTVLSYIDPEKGWESSLSFNVSGRRLYSISLAATPDVYEEEFPLLNFNLSKRFADHYQVTVSARNLLNPENRKTMDYKGQTYIAEAYQLGMNFGLSVAYFIR
ncbi:MAG: TonB-dependent receptor [Saprospirales bacterium]|nr:TonB-dependent receptor [Saprospirales bacterium]